MKNPFRKVMFLLSLVAVIFSMFSLFENREKDLIQPNEEQINNFLKRPMKREDKEMFSPFSSLYKEHQIQSSDTILQEKNIIYYLQENTILRWNEDTLEFQERAFPSFYPVEMQIYQQQLIVFGVESNEKKIQIDEGKSFPYTEYEFQILCLNKNNLEKTRQIRFYHSYFLQSTLVNGTLYFSLGTTDIVNKSRQEFIYPRFKDSLFPLEKTLSKENIFMLQDGQPIYSMTLLCKLNLHSLFNAIEMIGLLGVDGMMDINSSYIIMSSASYSEDMHTHFLFFCLTDFTYQGKVTLKGYIMNAESMNLYGNYFRVLLSYYENDGVYHQVYNVRIPEFKVLSMHEVAPLENIYCLRFQKNLLYISAFQYIDPLYVLDFSDPKKIRSILKKETQWIQEYMEIYSDYILTIGRKIDQDLSPKEVVVSTLHPKTLDVLQTYTFDEKVSLQVIWNERAIIKKDNLWFFLGTMDQKSYIFRMKIQPTMELFSPILLHEEWLQRIVLGQKYLIAFGLEGLYLYDQENFKLAHTFTYKRNDKNL